MVLQDLLRKARQTARVKLYRVRENQEKHVSPIEDYPLAFVVIPGEWTGYHLERRDKAIRHFRNEVGIVSDTIMKFVACMAMMDDWGNIPGIDGDMKSWDKDKIPTPIIAWVNEIVWDDFVASLTVPKAPSSPLQDGPEAVEEMAVGASEKTP